MPIVLNDTFVGRLQYMVYSQLYCTTIRPYV